LVFFTRTIDPPSFFRGNMRPPCGAFFSRRKAACTTGGSARVLQEARFRAVAITVNGRCPLNPQCAGLGACFPPTIRGGGRAIPTGAATTEKQGSGQVHNHYGNDICEAGGVWLSRAIGKGLRRACAAFVSRSCNRQGRWPGCGTRWRPRVGPRKVLHSTPWTKLGPVA